MSGFYVTFIFLGVLLVIVSLICIFLDKKKVFNFSKTFDAKKQELAEIISDAELMIDELNNYSDYIVNQMDLKNEELSRNLKEATQKIESLRQKAKSINKESNIEHEVVDEAVEIAIEEAANDEAVDDIAMRSSEAAVLTNSLSKTRISTIKNSSTLAVAVNSADAVAAAYTRASDRHIHSRANARKDKVIPLGNKYSEVLRYSREGMKSLDIARELNMGKGEVELIIGLKK